MARGPRTNTPHAWTRAVLGLACCAVLAGPAGADAPQFVREWGTRGPGADELDRPRGIDINSQGVVFVTDDMKHRVFMFDRMGNSLGGWGEFGSGAGEFDAPLGIIADDSGYVYVVDTRNFRIQKFTSSGSFVLEWGSFGTAPGSFSALWDVAVDANGDVYVTDASRVQKFDSNGNFIRTWGSLGAGEGQFKTARNITVGPDQTIYVSNGGSSASEATADVQRFTRDGTFLGRWGNFGEAPGQFMTILGLETDASGVVYVVDHHNFRIQNFTASGGFICAWAQRGPRGPNGNLEAPHDIAIDDDGDIFIVDITNDGAIQHFSYTVSLQHTSWSSVKSLFVPPTDPSDP